MALNATTLPHALNSPNDHGPVVNITAWLSIVISVLAVVARMGTKWIVQHKIEWDDGAIIVALIAAVGQTVAVSSGTFNGSGKHIQDLDASQIDRFQKALFTSNILFIMSLCFVKISVTLTVHFLKPFHSNRKMCLALGAGTLIWTVLSILLIAFQCSIPDTWRFDHNECINRTGYWTFINVISIIIDAFLIIIPIFILRELQIRLQRKLLVMAVFWSRIFVIGATITLIVITIHQTPTADPSFDFTPIVLTTTITMSLNITIACFPYLKPFLESLESGMIRSDDLFRRQGGSKTKFCRSYPLVPPSNTSSKKSQNHTNNSRNADGEASTEILGNAQALHDDLRTSPKGTVEPLDTEWNRVGHRYENVARVTAESPRQREADVESQSSRSRIIRQTTTWMVSRDTVEV